MTDPTNIPLAMAAAGLTVFGVATGIDPGLLFAGLAGGWWAMSYQDAPISLLRRITVGGVSALAGAYIGHPLASVLAAWMAALFEWWPQEVGPLSLRYACALVVGLVAHRKLGPRILRRFDEVTK